MKGIFGQWRNKEKEHLFIVLFKDWITTSIPCILFQRNLEKFNIKSITIWSWMKDEGPFDLNNLLVKLGLWRVNTYLTTSIAYKIYINIFYS